MNLLIDFYKLLMNLKLDMSLSKRRMMKEIVNSKMLAMLILLLMTKTSMKVTLNVSPLRLD